MTLNRFVTTLVQVALWVLILSEMLFAHHTKEIERETKQHMRDANRPKKRFVYCDGRKGATVAVEFVTDDEFNAYETVPYALIDVNNRSAYFDVHRYMDDNK